jgi:hypothetical protein
MKRLGILTFVMIAVLSHTGVAYAAEDIVIEKSTTSIDIENDGTFTQINELLIQLVSEQGAKGVGQLPIPFNDSQQTVEIVDAYTVKPDGTRLTVGSDKIFTQASQVSVEAPIFSDMKFKIIVFPDPQAGGKIYFKVKIKQTTAVFRNHFSFYELVQRPVPIRAFSISISAPADYALQIASRGVAGGKQADKDGRANWKWTYAFASSKTPEPYEVANVGSEIYVAASSFESWAALAKAYAKRASAKVVVTPQIQMLANQITDGIREPRDQARAIHQWVASNVRYVGVLLGMGGFVPRDAAEILQTKYGDCKDHTVILEALLRAKGIDATTILINTSPRYELPNIPVTGAFNHAITYIPSLDMYLDGTASFNAFGTMALADYSKPVLNISTGEITKTPTATASTNTVTNKVEMELKEDGSVTGRTSVISNGSFEADLRALIASIPAQGTDKLIPVLLGNKQIGTGAYTSRDPHKLDTRLDFNAQFEMKDAITLQSPGAFPIPRGAVFRDAHAVVDLAGLTSPSRTTSFVCHSSTSIDDITLLLPSAVKVASLPKDADFKSKTLTFSARYRQEGQKIIVIRSVVKNQLSDVCEPHMWEDFVKLAEALARDARGQVLLR